jgi:dsDNA-specific endonuclease/ATPase MutS2
VESLALEKDKRKKGRRLNLCGEESAGVEIYTPGKVVQAREYMEAKDAKEQAEHEAKEARKVQRAANGLIRKQKQAEKEVRQAAAQLAKELRMLNPAPPKTLTKKKQPVVHKAKKPGTKVLKAKELVTTSKEPSKTPAKSPEKAVVVEEVEEVVICQNSRGRTIKLLERFKNKKQ